MNFLISRFKKNFLFLIFFNIVIFSFTISAATYTVVNTNDNGIGSFRQAVINASWGDTIVFSGISYPDTIRLTSGPVNISNASITVMGPGANLLSISGEGLSQIITFGEGDAEFYGLSFNNGYAYGFLNGGAFNTSSGFLSLHDCIVSNNVSIGDSVQLSSAGLGGAIYNTNSLIIVRSSIINNKSIGGFGNDGYGGAIYQIGGSCTIINSTISGNTVNGGPAAIGTNSGIGGAIANQSGSLTISNSTISSNYAIDGAGGGIFNFPGGNITLTNTIIANNSSPSNSDVSGIFGSLGYNLIGVTGSSSGWTSFDIRNMNAKLGLLKNNGGPTPTHGILPGSPAIDAGDSTAAPPTDQRGFSRINDGNGDDIPNIDIGSYEAVIPLKPTGLAATHGDKTVFLTWNPNLEPNIRRYNIYRNGTPVDSVFFPSTMYADINLVNGQMYLYNITAVDSIGFESSLSLPDSANPNGPPRWQVPSDSLSFFEDDSLIIDLDDYVFDDSDPDDSLTISVPFASSVLEISFDPQTHIAVFKAPSDYNGMDSCVFRAVDPRGLVGTDTITIYIKPVNDPPYITTPLPDTTLIEDFGNLQIYDLTNYFDDVDNYSHHRDSLFATVQTLNGVAIASLVQDTILALTSIPDMNGIESVIVTVFDSMLTSVSDTFQVFVTALNDTPKIGNITGQTINEGENFAAITLDEFVTDVDNISSELEWTYFGNPELSVNIDSNRVATISTPDSNWNGSETITFRVTDPGNLFDEVDVTFTAIQINDPPYVKMHIPDTTLFEDFGNFLMIDLTTVFDDADMRYGDSLAGNISILNGLIDATVMDTLLYLRSVSNRNGIDIVIIDVFDLASATVSDTFMVTITTVNDTPVVSAVPDQIIFEGQEFPTVDLDNFVNDVDNADNELTWTFSGNSELIVTIDTSKVVKIVIPNLNWNGSETITFRATDPGNLYDEMNVNFIVNPINDYPVITALPDTFVTTYTDFIYQVDVFDPEGDELQYSDNSTLFDVDSAGLIDFRPTMSDTGKHEIIIYVSDNDTTVQDTFSLAVLPSIVSAPTILSVTGENQTLNVVWNHTQTQFYSGTRIKISKTIVHPDSGLLVLDTVLTTAGNISHRITGLDIDQLYYLSVYNYFAEGGDELHSTYALSSGATLGDLYAPLVTIDSKPDSIIYEAAVRFSFTANDTSLSPIGDIPENLWTNYILRNTTTGQEKRVDSLNTDEIVEYPLPDGLYEFNLWVYDRVGNGLDSAAFSAKFVINASKKTLPDRRWVLFSIPRDQNFALPTSLMTDSTVAIFRWDSKLEEYHQVTTTPLKPGFGYWLYAGRNIQVDLSSIPLQSTDSIEATIKTGWNQIGVPSAYSIEWNQVTLSSISPAAHNVPLPQAITDHLINPGIYWYPVSGYNWGSADTTFGNPWRGYWIHSNVDGVIKFPKAPAFHTIGNSINPLMKPLSDDWQINLSVTSNQFKDKKNIVGVSAAKQVQYMEPPIMDRYVSMYFKPDQDKLTAIYDAPFKDVKDVKKWQVYLETSEIKNEHAIDWQVPDNGVYYYLVDNRNEKIIDLNAETGYTFNPNSGKSEFTLYATFDPEFQPKIIPVDFKLKQNYPNPFNPVTTIEFGVPDFAENKVTRLKIYNLLGQEIATLIDGRLTSGYHKITWDGSNSTGRKVASGVYFYRLISGDKTLVKKMVLIR